MLYLQYNTKPENKLCNPDGTFDDLYEKSWFEDKTVVKIAEGVDDVHHLFDDIFEHDTFGKFIASRLSGGAKMLILAYLGVLSDRAYPLSWLGDNCYDWLEVISEKRDTTWDADCMLPPFCSYVNFVVKDTGVEIKSETDYMWSYARNRDFSLDY